MILRIISTLALWAITILAIYYGKAIGFGILMLILALAAGREACSLLQRCGMKPIFWIYCVATFAIFVLPACEPKLSLPLTGVLLFAIFALFALWILQHPYSDVPLKTVFPTLLLTLFIPGMLCWYIIIAQADYAGASGRLEYGGVILAVWAVAAAKFSDVGGYLFGMLFGRHKMSPNISPKKTWEGAVGGIFLSSAISAAIAWGFAEQLPAFFTPCFAAAAALPVAVIAICSDLLESVLKRRADIKDSGRSIPGIGGALDLADSMLLPAPFVMLIFIFAK